MCVNRSHVNFAIDILYMNISNEPQVTICTLFVVDFVFLSVTLLEFLNFFFEN